mmetsp:Transcript_41473/g.63284  ORF Transcript_41473/g.63284 Transcript_41473/m.63284 type:complete len:215 (-) Transcript_41473:337-981(-)
MDSVGGEDYLFFDRELDLEVEVDTVIFLRGLPAAVNLVRPSRSGLWTNYLYLRGFFFCAWMRVSNSFFRLWFFFSLQPSPAVSFLTLPKFTFSFIGGEGDLLALLGFDLSLSLEWEVGFFMTFDLDRYLLTVRCNFELAFNTVVPPNSIFMGFLFGNILISGENSWAFDLGRPVDLSRFFSSEEVLFIWLLTKVSSLERFWCTLTTLDICDSLS